MGEKNDQPVKTLEPRVEHLVTDGVYASEYALGRRDYDAFTKANEKFQDDLRKLPEPVRKRAVERANEMTQLQINESYDLGGPTIYIKPDLTIAAIKGGDKAGPDRYFHELPDRKRLKDDKLEELVTTGLSSIRAGFDKKDDTSFPEAVEKFQEKLGKLSDVDKKLVIDRANQLMQDQINLKSEKETVYISSSGGIFMIYGGAKAGPHRAMERRLDY